MNRPLKFRVWDNELKKFGNPDQYGLILRYGLIHGKEKHPEYSIYYNPNVIIQQYTGLNDKNGKDIYEGDIILHGDLRYLVQWDDWGLRWSAICPYHVVYKRATTIEHFCHLRSGSIIGNIFENPELLK